MVINNGSLVQITKDDFLSYGIFIVPDGVEKIASEVFERAKLSQYMKQVWLPKTCKIINQYSFSNCKKLEKVLFYDDLKDIEDYKNGVKGEKELIKNNNLESLGRGAFLNTGLKSFTFTSKLKEIEGVCFLNSKLKKVTFADDCELTDFDMSMFNGCKNLKEVRLPKSVKNIETDIDNIKDMTFYVHNNPKIENLSLSYRDVVPNSSNVIINYVDENMPSLDACSLIKVDSKENITIVVKYVKKDEFFKDVVTTIYDGDKVIDYKIDQSKISLKDGNINDRVLKNGLLNFYLFEKVMDSLGYTKSVRSEIVECFEDEESIKKYLTIRRINKIYRKVENNILAFCVANRLNEKLAIKGLINMSFMMGSFSDNEMLRQKSSDFIYQMTNFSATNSIYETSLSVYKLLCLLANVKMKINNDNESQYHFWKDNIVNLFANYKQWFHTSTYEIGLEFVDYINENFNKVKKICYVNKKEFNLSNAIEVFKNSRFVVKNPKMIDICNELKNYIGFKDLDKNLIDFVYGLKNDMLVNKIPQNIFEKFDESKSCQMFNESQLVDSLSDKTVDGYRFCWMNKYRTKNLTYVIDDRTGCANIFGIGNGIAIGGMTLPKCQNLRIFDENGKGIARATIILNAEKGELLYNTFMVYGHTDMILRDKYRILEAFRYATSSFVREYEKNFPNNPKISKVNVGTSFNGLSKVLKTMCEIDTCKMQGIDFTRYARGDDAAIFWGGDWDEEQFVFLNREQILDINDKYDLINNMQFDAEDNNNL